MSQEQIIPEHVCGTCGKNFKNAKGLQGHMRLAHEHPTKDDSAKEYIDSAISEMQAEMRRRLEKFDNGSAEIVCKDCGQFLGRNKSQVEDLTGCPKCGSTKATTLRDGSDQRITVIGRLLESVMDALVRVDDRVRFCEDDIKGLRYIGVSPSKFTLEHVSEVKK
jgi:DNA-directed RNA polymerase subunit RPC12/RpoP